MNQCVLRHTLEHSRCYLRVVQWFLPQSLVTRKAGHGHVQISHSARVYAKDLSFPVKTCSHAIESCSSLAVDIDLPPSPVNVLGSCVFGCPSKEVCDSEDEVIGVFFKSDSDSDTTPIVDESNQHEGQKQKVRTPRW